MIDRKRNVGGESALMHERILQDQSFDQYKISVKASDVLLTMESYRQLAKVTKAPLHLGVTEAGGLMTGSIKSSIGIGSLLMNGIQNKYIWMKAAMGILTTDLKPKLAMEECYIGNKLIRIYGIAKGSGMIFPNIIIFKRFIRFKNN